MGDIDRIGFKTWLKNNQSTTDKVIMDTISRADRVRRAFEKINPEFSFEKEVERDNGNDLWKLISRRGKNIKETIDLPIGSNQMDSISSAAKKYIMFLREKKDSQALPDK